MANGVRRGGSSFDIWPGFVDALAALLMVITFLVMIFAVAQFYLTDLLTGRDKALAKLNAQVNELAEILSLERAANTELTESVAQLSGDLRVALGARDDLTVEVAELTGRLATAMAATAATQAQLDEALKTIQADKETIEFKVQELAGLAAARRALEASLQAVRAEAAESAAAAEQAAEAAAERAATAAEQAAALAERTAAAAEQASADLVDAYQTIDAEKEKIRLKLREIAALEAAREALAKQLEEMAERGRVTSVALEDERELGAKAASQLEILNIQIAELRQQIAALNEALNAAEAKDVEQKVVIANLGARLNVALASKVQELARYRSEFFGRLREALGQRPNIRIVGDRFIVQSEVLFDTGSAELQPEGLEQLRIVATTVADIAKVIPGDIDWVLQVEGHTDKRPIASSQFPSNWELSTSRAISVVKFLIDTGVPAGRLAAAGFGEFHPLDAKDDEIAYRRNRRIELRLTQPNS